MAETTTEPATADPDDRYFIEPAPGTKKKMVKETLAMLVPGVRTRFAPSIKPSDISDEGVLKGNKARLEWRKRAFPDEPASYDNQQTRYGSVFIVFDGTVLDLTKPLPCGRTRTEYSKQLRLG